MPEKRRLVYFIASLLLLGFVLTSIGSYFVSRDALREQIMSSGLPLTADNIYTAIQNDLIPPIFVSSLMAQDTFLRDWALAGEQDPDRVIRYLDQIQQRYETVTAFYVSENTRNYYHPSGIVEQISRDDPTDAWFFRVRDMEDSYEINVDYDEANNFSLTIFVNYKVFDYEGRFIGVTGVGLLVDNVRELVERYRKRFERRIYFVDATGGIVLSGNRFDETRPNIHSMPGIGRIAEAILATDVGSFTYTVDGETVLLSYRYIEELEWHVLVEQREGTVTREVWNTLLVSLAFQLTVALVVIAATSATINIYQRRLEKMAMTDTLTG
ncbi:MAG: cache domain-containing protein, partial [Candidatus Competibacterales bacterium]|nr:cache domain-containing protein [Candidatus Competibacterales bacterium]